MNPGRDALDVAVVGGGIAGVTLAIGLLNHQIPVTLYESAARFGEIGAGVGFGPNATRAMSLIHPDIKQGFENRATHNLWASKQDVWFDFRYGQQQGAKADAGQLIHSLPCPHGQGSVHRAHYLDEMVQLVPASIARFSKRLVDLDDQGARGVVLHFADGSSARHAAVIGCDGIKSRTRRLLLGKDNPAATAVFTGKYAYRGLVPMEKARDLLGEELAANSQMYLGRHGHVLTFPIEKGKTMNVVAFGSSDSWDHEEWVRSLKKEDMYAEFDTWGDKVKQIIGLMEKPDVWALFNHPPAETYCKGRICLLGDAAHASTPHNGAGAGMAVEDAFLMSRLMAEVADPSEIPAAFEAFDAVRRPRTQHLVTKSKESGQLYDLELAGVGNDPEKLKQNLDARMQWIWDYDHRAELEQAKQVFQQKRGKETVKDVDSSVAPSIVACH